MTGLTGLTSQSSRKTAGNLKAEWRTRFIAILRSLDSKHEHYVVEEVFEAQFAFADDYLTLNLNLRLRIVCFDHKEAAWSTL